MKKYRIAIACDHAGFAYKSKLIPLLADKGHTIKDYGTHSEQNMDYPDVVHPLAKAVEKGDFDYGFLFCGSGNGVSMTANKYKGIRAALCWNSEISKLARLHNNANICCIPSRFISYNEALTIIVSFLETDFEGGRHQCRIEKIPFK